MSRRSYAAIVNAVALGLITSACSTVHYRQDETGFNVQNAAGSALDGVPTFVNPTILEMLVANEQTNLPLYYARIASWGNEAPGGGMMADIHKKAATDAAEVFKAVGSYPDLGQVPEADQALASDLADGKIDPAAGDNLKKVGRIAALVRGHLLARHIARGLVNEGKVLVGWGHKMEEDSQDLKFGMNMFQIAADPDAMTVTVYGGRPHSNIALGESRVFDVSEIDGAFECRDPSGEVHAVTMESFDATWDKCHRLPYEKVAAGMVEMTGD